MTDPFLASRYLAHPPDYKIDDRGLALYPMPCFFGRGAEFLGRRTTGHGTLALT